MYPCIIALMPMAAKISMSVSYCFLTLARKSE